MVLNASAWQAADEDPAEGGTEAADAGAGGEEEGDDLWDSFRSVAEREKQQVRALELHNNGCDCGRLRLD